MATTGTMDSLQHWITENEWKLLEKSRPLLSRLKSNTKKSKSSAKNGAGQENGNHEPLDPIHAANLLEIPARENYHLDHTRKRVFRLARSSGVVGKFRIKCRLTMSDSEFYSIFQKFNPVSDLSLASWKAGFTPVKGFSKSVSLEDALKGKGPFLDVRRVTAAHEILHDWCAFEQFPARYGGRGGMLLVANGWVIAVAELVAVLSISLKRLVGQQFQAHLFVTTVRFNPTTRALSYNPAMETLAAFGGPFIQDLRDAMAALNPVITPMVE